MEVKREISSSGLTAKSDEAPDGYRVASVSENANPVQIGGPTLVMNPPPAPATTAPAAAPAATSAVVAPPAGLAVSSLDGKKKRGRPKKYGPDGLALSPMPISASIPLTGDFTGWQESRGTPAEPVKKKHKFEVESPGMNFLNGVSVNIGWYCNAVSFDGFSILSCCGHLEDYKAVLFMIWELQESGDRRSQNLLGTLDFFLLVDLILLISNASVRCFLFLFLKFNCFPFW